jgi:hypothetical protein
MNTYGMHSIHGRSPAIATGLAMARPDLDVWVIGGDGDMLSIGGNHLIHALRRNVNITILMFNNQIYGLTKGQYSPTSETGKVTKSTPFGSIEQPFNPISVALGAEATFVARTHDMDRKHMMESSAGPRPPGAAFVEIYQNCNVFNDGAFEAVTGKANREDMVIPLVHGEPIVFGKERDKGVTMRPDGHLEVVTVADVGLENILVHAEDDTNGLAFMLSRLAKGPPNPRPSACSAPSSGASTASTAARCRPRSPPPSQPAAPATCTPSCTAAPPGRSESLQRAEHHARTGLGMEERRLRGHTLAPVGDVDDLATVTGRRSTPAWASPSATARLTWSMPCWKVTVGSSRSASAASRRNRVEVAQAGEGPSRGVSSELPASTSTRQPCSRMRPAMPGSTGPAGVTTNHGSSAAARSNPSGSPLMRRWMGSTDSCSSASSTT